MTAWGELRDAYGSADGVPLLLAAAESSGEQFGPAWDDVWSHLCHQGTVYSASYAAIPLLANICSRQRPRGYLAGLHLAACIIASTDGPADTRSVRDQYAADIARLRDLAEAVLPLAENDAEFVYGLETLAAFEDRGAWQRSLNYLADGEAPLLCPSCGDDLLLQIQDLPPRVITWDSAQGVREVTPTDPMPGTDEHRLLVLAAGHGRSHVAEKLRFYFGKSRCPACGTGFFIAGAFA